jgi:hypothetical protein
MFEFRSLGGGCRKDFFGIAASTFAELAFDNSAILLRSKVSLRKIVSHIKAQSATKSSGLSAKKNNLVFFSKRTQS